MYYSKMVPYLHYKRVTSTDALGYQFDTWSTPNTIMCYMVRSAETRLISNEMKFIKYDKVGYTDSQYVAIGDRVGTYLVEDVIPTRHGSTLMLNVLADDFGEEDD